MPHPSEALVYLVRDGLHERRITRRSRHVVELLVVSVEEPKPERHVGVSIRERRGCTHRDHLGGGQGGEAESLRPKGRPDHDLVVRDMYPYSPGPPEPDPAKDHPEAEEQATTCVEIPGRESRRGGGTWREGRQHLAAELTRV